MKTMSSSEIKDRYGLFAKTTRREPVVHTSHGRPTLVTISIERAKAIPELRAELFGEERRKKTNVLLDALGKGAHLSSYRDEEDVVATLRRARDAHMRTPLIVLSLFSFGLVGCNSSVQRKEADTFAEQQERYRNSDCASGVFHPRSYPMGIINIAASYETGDPNNATTGSVYAKCVDGKSNAHHICGVVARRNSVVYIDRAKKFYGIYYLDEDETKSFSISATGEKAESICQKLGI